MEVKGRTGEIQKGLWMVRYDKETDQWDYHISAGLRKAHLIRSFGRVSYQTEIRNRKRAGAWRGRSYKRRRVWKHLKQNEQKLSYGKP